MAAKPMPPADDLGFVHKVIPAKTEEYHPVTLLLLHGTGGEENDLLSLGDELWPGAAQLGTGHASSRG
jgi:predicted esterase